MPGMFWPPDGCPFCFIKNIAYEVSVSFTRGLSPEALPCRAMTLSVSRAPLPSTSIPIFTKPVTDENEVNHYTSYNNLAEPSEDPIRGSSVAN